MRIESTAFEAADMTSYMDELIDHERRHLAGRLEKLSDRLAELGARVSEVGPPGGESWSGREILAHIAVLSKFYGMLTYKIGSGQMSELDLLGGIKLRDVLGEQLSKEAPARLVEMARSDHARTVDYLRGADAKALRRQCSVTGAGTMTAGDVARLPLIAHLESHLDQLEESLRT